MVETMPRQSAHPAWNVNGSAVWVSAEQRKPGQGRVATFDHPHIEALINSAGHIMTCAIKPERNATVVCDEVDSERCRRLGDDLSKPNLRIEGQNLIT